MQDNIKAYFTESIQTQIAAAEALPDSINKAANLLVKALLDDGKIFSCGNGITQAHAQLFVMKLVNRFEMERPSLPAISLASEHVTFTAKSARSNDTIYARQLGALASERDVLLAISINGEDQNIINAVEAAVRRDMSIIILTGGNGGELPGLLGANDVDIRIPAQREPRIEEMQTTILNCLCALVDSALFQQQ